MNNLQSYLNTSENQLCKFFLKEEKIYDFILNKERATFDFGYFKEIYESWHSKTFIWNLQGIHEHDNPGKRLSFSLDSRSKYSVFKLRALEKILKHCYIKQYEYFVRATGDKTDAHMYIENKSEAESKNISSDKSGTIVMLQKRSILLLEKIYQLCLKNFNIFFSHREGIAKDRNLFFERVLSVFQLLKESLSQVKEVVLQDGKIAIILWPTAEKDGTEKDIGSYIENFVRQNWPIILAMNPSSNEGLNREDDTLLKMISFIGFSSRENISSFLYDAEIRNEEFAHMIHTTIQGKEKNKVSELQKVIRGLDTNLREFEDLRSKFESSICDTLQKNLPFEVRVEEEKKSVKSSKSFLNITGKNGLLLGGGTFVASAAIYSIASKGDVIMTPQSAFEDTDEDTDDDSW